ncbi:hypothetical protein [Cytobacillus sp. IB215665]|uniref:hypothetical protein n=1 Tax=Cytobacillus sp. IB215665 TaxID=3097357 RepID=UPI002A0DA6B2|nr:hypothetical protein [Cytobacillus sp. IB215665]MDX8364558.1 hypothetical protein [Cytobacillus sp. IB215665]
MISTFLAMVAENIVWLNNRYEFQTGIFVENEDGSKGLENKNNDFDVLQDLNDL